MDDSPFGKLSAELRNEIYLHAITNAEPVSLFDEIRAPLTRVCKQMRVETLQMVHANSTFNIDLGVGKTGGKNKGHRLDFQQRARSAVAWLEHHRVVPHLVITCMLQFNRRSDNTIEKEMKAFAEKIRRLGYGNEHLEIHVNGYGKAFSRDRHEMADSLKTMGFGRVGLYINGKTAAIR